MKLYLKSTARCLKTTLSVFKRFSFLALLKNSFLTNWPQEPNLSLFLSVYMPFLTGSIFNAIEILLNVRDKWRYHGTKIMLVNKAGN